MATARFTTWHAWFVLGLVFAARNGNWLLSRKANGASALLLTGVWIEIAIGLAVAWWAYRHMRSAQPSVSAR